METRWPFLVRRDSVGCRASLRISGENQRPSDPQSRGREACVNQAELYARAVRLTKRWTSCRLRQGAVRLSTTAGHRGRVTPNWRLAVVAAVTAPSLEQFSGLGASRFRSGLLGRGQARSPPNSPTAACCIPHSPDAQTSGDHAARLPTECPTVSPCNAHHPPGEGVDLPAPPPGIVGEFEDVAVVRWEVTINGEKRPVFEEALARGTLSSSRSGNSGIIAALRRFALRASTNARWSAMSSLLMVPFAAPSARRESW
jgi:hypothetical protein